MSQRQLPIKNWESIRIFLQVARCGGFRNAARMLGISQPTIGRRIDELEKALSERLFIRTRAGVSLTPFGSEMLTRAEEVERAVQFAAKGTQAPSGHIRIAMTDAMAGYWLPGHLREFVRQNPYITLDIKTIGFGQDVNLTDREADISVLYKPPLDLDVVVLHESYMEVAPFCHKIFTETWGIPKSIEDVINYPVITQPFHHYKIGAMTPWANMLEKHNMIVARTTSSIVSVLMVKAGVGICLQPVGVLDREEDFHLIELNSFRCYLPFFLACHKNVKNVPAVRVVIDYLRANLFEAEHGSPASKVLPALEKPSADIADFTLKA